MDRPKRERLLYLALLIAVLLVFGRTIFYPLLWWDDRQHICQNPFLHPPSLQNIYTLWTQSYFGLYAPLAYSFWLLPVGISRWVWGIQSNCLEWGAPFHAMNLLLHIVNTLLVFHLLKKLLPQRTSAALLGALLFSLHPLQVETVAWAAAERDLLNASFGFAGVIMFLDNRWKTATLFFALSALTKATGIVFPFLALLLTRRIDFKIVPSLLISVAIGIVAKQLQPDTALNFSSPFWFRPVIFAQAYGFYLWKSFIPWGLVPDYARSIQSVSMRPGLNWTAALGVLSFVLAYVWRPLRLSLAWILISLLPVSGLLSFGFQETSTVADRFFYVPMFGIAYAFSLLTHRYAKSNQVTFLNAAGYGGILAGFAALSIYQIQFWESDELLFRRNASVVPESPVAHSNLANALFHRNALEEAEKEFRETLHLQRSNKQAWLGLSRTLEKTDRVTAAEAAYLDAISSNAALPETYNNLGTMYYQRGENDKAEMHWNQAAKMNEWYMEPRFNLGQLYLRFGKIDEAENAFNAAARVAPEDSRVQERLNFIRQVRTSSKH